jgi:hypothetical protein
MVRGVILELRAGESVTIQTPSGQVHEFPMADVAYAGASGDAPNGAPTAPPEAPAAQAAPDPPGSPLGTDVPIRLLAKQPGVMFHWYGGSTPQDLSHTSPAPPGPNAGYVPLCAPPCAASLPAGTYHLALSRRGGRPVEAGPVRVEGPTELYGDYRRRSGIRAGGWVLMIAGAVGGSVMIAAGASGLSCVREPGCDIDGGSQAAVLSAGIVLVVASLVTGMIMATRKARATVGVVPLPPVQPTATPSDPAMLAPAPAPAQ